MVGRDKGIHFWFELKQYMRWKYGRREDGNERDALDFTVHDKRRDEMGGRFVLDDTQEVEYARLHA